MITLKIQINKNGVVDYIGSNITKNTHERHILKMITLLKIHSIIYYYFVFRNRELLCI